MKRAGIISSENQVQLQFPSELPVGTKVYVFTTNEFPPETTPDEELAGLLESIEDMKAGRVISAEEVMKDLDARICQHELNHIQQGLDDIAAGDVSPAADFLREMDERFKIRLAERGM